MSIENIKDKTPNQDLIDMLEKLLESAKTGHLRTCVGLFGWNDDRWTDGWQIDDRNSRRRMLGEMSLLQHNLLTWVAFNDGDSTINKIVDLIDK